MADTKISQLPSATTPLSGAELVPLVQSGATVQTPTNEISKLTAATANTFTANQIIEVTDNVNAALRVTQLGTADALRIEDSTNPDSTPFIVDASGNVGIGTTAAAGVKLAVGGSTPAAGKVSVVGDNGGISLALSDNVNGSAYIKHQTPNTVIGTDAGGGFGIATNGFTERLRVDNNGNILNISSGGLGYGTGSGGTVTQLTSKTTGVTLNKTNGRITTAADALGAGATAAFTVTNSTMAGSDVVIVNITNGNYSGRVYNNNNGSFIILLKNETGGSLSDAVVINFAIIKGATS